jgi:predicted SprT family Zn-dependent metalloprotease
MRSILLTAAVLALSTAGLSETLYTSRKSNPVREGPGSYYGLVGTVAGNIAVMVLSRTDSWVKVELPNKKVGWIARNSLTPEKNNRIAVGSPGSMWSSPKALSAAIKGFGEKYSGGSPAVVDSVLLYSRKDFTSEALAEFEKEINENPSDNRGRMDVDDLDLPEPEYVAELPEQQIGMGIAARLAGKGIVGDRTLQNYVNKVCATIARNSSLYDADFTVLVLDDRRINAFAVPGGYIFLTRGMLLQCRDESELGGIIAHELAHLSRRHGLQEVSKRLAGIHSDQAFQELEEEVGGATEEEMELESLLDESYERVVHPRLLSYEVEADRIGAILAANAGYDPFGLVRISERVATMSKQVPDIFDTDYMSPNDAVDRAGKIRAFAEENFTTGNPGGQMTGRFTAGTASLR